MGIDRRPLSLKVKFTLTVGTAIALALILATGAVLLRFYRERREARAAVRKPAFDIYCPGPNGLLEDAEDDVQSWTVASATSRT